MSYREPQQDFVTRNGLDVEPSPECEESDGRGLFAWRKSDIRLCVHILIAICVAYAALQIAVRLTVWLCQPHVGGTS